MNIEHIQLIIDAMQDLGEEAKGAFIAYIVLAIGLPPLLSAVVWIVGWSAIYKTGVRISKIWIKDKKPITQEEAEFLKIQTEADKAEAEKLKANQKVVFDGSEACVLLEKICKETGAYWYTGNKASYLDIEVRQLPFKIRELVNFKKLQEASES